MVRPRLQGALLKEVDQSRSHVSKKLVEMEQLPTGRLRIVFEDGLHDEVDLVVGADGIRSVVRSFCFPDHTMRYNGQSAYRTLVDAADAAAICQVVRDAFRAKHQLVDGKIGSMKSNF
jgi:salicylate hydroxylase